jgi:hypothetical protein
MWHCQCAMCEVCIGETLASYVSRSKFKASLVVHVATVVEAESLFVDVTEEMEWLN